MRTSESLNNAFRAQNGVQQSLNFVTRMNSDQKNANHMLMAIVASLSQTNSLLMHIIRLLDEESGGRVVSSPN